MIEKKLHCDSVARNQPAVKEPVMDQPFSAGRTFRFQDSKSAVDIQRARYFTESFRHSEGEALSLRWAKALNHIAENIDVIINDDELLVGRAGKSGKYGLVYPELDGCFLK